MKKNITINSNIFWNCKVTYKIMFIANKNKINLIIL